MFLAPDTELGTFQIVRLLGSGGMGEVYLARDRPLDRAVAIKVLHGDAIEPHHLARFEREARAASTLSHPNVAHIYLLGETPDGRRYLAMEYIEGVPLDQRLIERCQSPRPSTSPSRWRRPSPPRTPPASSIATSSPPT